MARVKIGIKVANLYDEFLIVIIYYKTVNRNCCIKS